MEIKRNGTKRKLMRTKIKKKQRKNQRKRTPRRNTVINDANTENGVIQ